MPRMSQESIEDFVLYAHLHMGIENEMEDFGKILMAQKTILQNHPQLKSLSSTNCKRRHLPRSSHGALQTSPRPKT